MCWSSWNVKLLEPSGPIQGLLFRITGINMTDEFQDAFQKSQNLLQHTYPSLRIIYVLQYRIFCLRKNILQWEVVTPIPKPPSWSNIPGGLDGKYEDIISLHLRERTTIYLYFLKQFYLQKIHFTRIFVSQSIKIIQNINEYFSPSKGCFHCLEYLILWPESLSFSSQIIHIAAWS